MATTSPNFWLGKDIGLYPSIWKCNQCFGGPGESHHKYFVKAPGDNTQRRVSEFAKQIANRIYESMIFEIAIKRHSNVKRMYTRW